MRGNVSKRRTQSIRRHGRDSLGDYNVCERYERAWRNSRGSDVRVTAFSRALGAACYNAALHMKLRSLLSCISLVACSAAPSDAPAAPSAGAAASAPAPGFRALYSSIIEPRCSACHKPGGLCPYLDLSTEHLAYRNVAGSASSMGVCKGAGSLLVAHDCKASLLYRKLLPEQLDCGSRMPLRDVPLTDDEISVVCQWIEAGAPE